MATEVHPPGGSTPPPAGPRCEGSAPPSPAAHGLRIGLGFDIHRLVAGRPLRLGGVEIPFEKGLLGHSDGDVLLHAIADAILGAAGLGDLGTLFPDTDPALRGADSRTLLAEAVRRAGDAGYLLAQVDTVVIAQRPRLAPHAAAMAEAIRRAAESPGLPVSVKARTAEGLGAIGAGEAIAALAMVLLVRKA